MANTKVPLVDLRAQYLSINEEVNAALQRVFEHSGFILGEEVERFEADFSEYISTTASAGVSSGTAALRLALLACGVGPEDEVIVPANTFFATAEAVSLVGARPLLVDVEEATFNLDPACVDMAIRNQSKDRSIKAIIAVHLYGHPAKMDVLSQLARRNGIVLIEDAAQAHGAAFRGAPCGSFGNAACFSFYPGKTLGAYGDAGLVTSHDEELIKKVRVLRDHGRLTKYEHGVVSGSERMDAIQAAFLNVKLRHLREWVELRRSHADKYGDLLHGLPVRLPREAADSFHAYHLYVIRVNGRDGLLTALKAEGIQAEIHYPVPLHRQPAFRHLDQPYELPQVEQMAGEILSLPIYPELSDQQIEYVVDSLYRNLERKS